MILKRALGYARPRSLVRAERVVRRPLIPYIVERLNADLDLTLAGLARELRDLGAPGSVTGTTIYWWLANACLRGTLRVEEEDVCDVG